MNLRLFEYFTYISNPSSYIPEFPCLENNTGLSYYEFLISFLETVFFMFLGKPFSVLDGKYEDREIP